MKNIFSEVDKRFKDPILFEKKSEGVYSLYSRELQKSYGPLISINHLSNPALWIEKNLEHHPDFYHAVIRFAGKDDDFKRLKLEKEEETDYSDQSIQISTDVFKHEILKFLDDVDIESVLLNNKSTMFKYWNESKKYITFNADIFFTYMDAKEKKTSFFLGAEVTFSDVYKIKIEPGYESVDLTVFPNIMGVVCATGCKIGLIKLPQSITTLILSDNHDDIFMIQKVSEPLFEEYEKSETNYIETHGKLEFLKIGKSKGVYMSIGSDIKTLKSDSPCWSLVDLSCESFSSVLDVQTAVIATYSDRTYGISKISSSKETRLKITESYLPSFLLDPNQSKIITIPSKSKETTVETNQKIMTNLSIWCQKDSDLNIIGEFGDITFTPSFLNSLRLSKSFTLGKLSKNLLVTLIFQEEDNGSLPPTLNTLILDSDTFKNEEFIDLVKKKRRFKNLVIQGEKFEL